MDPDRMTGEDIQDPMADRRLPDRPQLPATWIHPTPVFRLLAMTRTTRSGAAYRGQSRRLLFQQEAMLPKQWSWMRRAAAPLTRHKATASLASERAILMSPACLLFSRRGQPRLDAKRRT